MSAQHLRSGGKVYDIGGATLLLDKEIGRGGEGSVWSIQGDQRVAAKFYHKGMAPEHARKLEVMCRIKSHRLLKIAAWPTSTLRVSPSGPPEGLLMSRISGCQAAHLLYSPKSRRTAFPEAQFPFIVHSVANMVRAFAAIHHAGQVIGDVNHGNLLVSEQGTVILIDCDSFEIIDHHEVYPCLVGVPTYTPPELQGKNFQGVRRTVQHDAFGLAVLVFHMLFLGRHPFAGIYRNGTADMTIEQAISECRFAYSPDTKSTQMQPPPSAPRLTDFPPALSALFLRAFTRSGMNGSRPSAHEWIGPLENLSKDLKQCVANRSHHFSSHLTSCPWCRIEGMVGIPMFGIKIAITGTEKFNISELWAQIESILPTLESSSVPTSQSFIGSVTIDARIAGIVSKRRIRRIMSVAVIATTIGIVFAAQTEFVYSLVILVFGLLGMTRIWKSGETDGREFVAARREAFGSYSSAVAECRKFQGVPATFAEIKQKLWAARHTFDELPRIRSQKMAELNRARHDKQLRQFLESHRLEDAVLPNIGKGRKELLHVYNVEDAYDIEPFRIGNIKGIGPSICTTLLDWRDSVEQRFRFDPTQGIDPLEIRSLEQELGQKRADAIRILSSGPEKLKQSLASWNAQRELVFEQATRAAQHLAQAEANLKALSRW